MVIGCCEVVGPTGFGVHRVCVLCAAEQREVYGVGRLRLRLRLMRG